MTNWVELCVATGGWAAIVVTIVIYLHTRRASTIDLLNKKIDDYAKGDALAHEAMRVQIQDIGRGVSENYVKRDQLDADYRTLNENIVGVRKEVGAVANRVDELYRSVEWRDRSGE